jgi:hemoglobin/transferrin/lactoferrin receptor protein
MRLFMAMLLLGCGGIAYGASLRGFVSDSSGSRVPNATLEILDHDRVVASTHTTLSGAYDLTVAADGEFTLRVRASGFVDYLNPIRIEGNETLQVILPELSTVRADITVTARRGAVEESQSTPQVTTSTTGDALQSKRLQTVGHALEGAPGVMVQETTAGQSSPILRGLTGYQTLLLIDGVRLNTAIYRSGPNQYLSFVHPSQSDRVEAVLGPSGATFGSDSMGGTINVASAGTQSERPLQGEISAFGATADLSSGWTGRFTGRIKQLSYAFGGFTQHNNDLRTGGAADSRNSLRRYFGLDPGAVNDLLGERLPGTALTRDGAHGKASWRAGANQTLTAWYQHDELTGVRGYRDQWGGPGNLLSKVDPQVLDFGYLRYEKMRAGPFDFVSGTFSANAQQDGSAKQALRVTDPITTDRNSIASLGYAAQATGHIGSTQAFVFGTENYREKVSSSRSVFDPTSAKTAQPRAGYPDGSVYTTSAVYAQDAIDLFRSRLRLSGGVRYSWIRYRSFADLLGVPDSHRTFSDVTFHTAASWQAAKNVALHAVVSRGFRAPNMNDLGSVGAGAITLGYEFPAEEITPLNGQYALDTSDTAGTSGNRVASLKAESLDSYEGGVTWRSGRIYARAQVFDAELLNPITGRTVLFPVGAVPASLGGIAVTPLPQSAIQRQQGLVAVFTSFTPRAVKTTINDGHTKYYGTEDILEVRLSSRWTATFNYSFLVARDLYPNRPVRRLPPQQASSVLRYMPPGRRWWLELAGLAAGAQERLNGGDIDDDRIGASRRRSDIASFFNGGLATPFINLGPDGKRATADDTFRPTGETLLQIQNRVLPNVADSVRVPLYIRNAGWTSFALRGGVPLGERVSIAFVLSNLLDRNYRVYGSGVDAPGRGALLLLKYRF